MRAALLTALLLAACADEIDDRPARWSYISRAILQPNCATGSCHSAASQTAELRFDTADQGYASLLEEELVVPGDPASSELLEVLGWAASARRGGDDDGEDEGEAEMPPGNPLPDADVALIARWIEAGAEED
jgi:hypothetical protein